MKKGFIRAEVLSFDHLKEHGTVHDVKQKGLVHLEGKSTLSKMGTSFSSGLMCEKKCLK